MMKWEAESKGYTCNDCFLSMQNCHDKSICCEDETGLCDYFEEIPKAEEEEETDCDYERAVEQLEHDMLYEPTFNKDDGSM